jgi:hypothetical protein
MRIRLAIAGVFFFALWLASQAITVAHGPDVFQWTVGNSLAFLAGASFGAAAMAVQRTSA